MHTRTLIDRETVWHRNFEATRKIFTTLRCVQYVPKMSYTTLLSFCV